MAVSIEVTGIRGILSNINTHETNIPKKVKAGMIEAGLIHVETPAKEKLTSDGHVDTGRLRASIHIEYKEKRGHSYSDDYGETFQGRLSESIGKDDVVVGTNVEYAEMIEQFDSYLRYALNINKKKIMQTVQKRARI
jgi:hypothetical protein